MLYALNELNEKIAPTPASKAICPICGKEVISKCGQINAWHWSHINIQDCDPWNESENEWHYNWKSRFSSNNCEINIRNHRADILTSNNEVIELQSTYISPDEIIERERHYINMLWLFNVIDSEINIDFRNMKPGKNYASFRWKYPKKHIAYTTKPTILDLGNKLFILKKMFKSTPCGGWGYFISVNAFLNIKNFNNNSYFKKEIDPKNYWQTKNDY